MRVEARAGCEPPVANVAYPGVAVERVVGSRVLCGCIVVPFNLLLGDRAIGITLANYAVNGVTVQLRGLRAGSSFDMVSHSAGGGVSFFTEGANDSRAAMDP